MAREPAKVEVVIDGPIVELSAESGAMQVRNVRVQRPSSAQCTETEDRAIEKMLNVETATCAVSVSSVELKLNISGTPR